MQKICILIPHHLNLNEGINKLYVARFSCSPSLHKPNLMTKIDTQGNSLLCGGLD